MARLQRWTMPEVSTSGYTFAERVKGGLPLFRSKFGQRFRLVELDQRP